MKYYVAIADIHGEAVKLEDALRRIQMWAAYVWERKENDTLTYVFLGDLIDRGPDPRKVLDIVQAHVESNGSIIIKGNHDMMMIGTADGTTTHLGSRELAWADLWQHNDGIETCRQLHGYLPDQYQRPVIEVRGYAQKIKDSKEYKFFKEHGKEIFETELIHFSHAPQSDLKDLNYYWGHSSDYSHSNWDQIFKVPGGKRLSVHGHFHRLNQGVNYPRIVNRFKDNNQQTVVLADSGCGCGHMGALRPVIVRENMKEDNGLANFAEVVAIL
jgi:hypothetical protein